jgi:hypothetical protein
VRLSLTKFSVEAPSDGNDESQLVIADKATPPQWHLQVHSAPLPSGRGGLEAFVMAQEPAPGAVLDGQESFEANGTRRIVWRLHLDVAGSVLRQSIGYVAVSDVVVIVTMTAQDRALPKANTVFQQTLDSIVARSEKE